MTKDQDKFTISFLATELEARQAILSTSGRLRAGGIPRHRADEIEIALAEAINNVVEHAYAGREPGMVRILCNLQWEHLTVRICDDGTPLPQNRLPQGLAAELSGAKADLPEGGFGWFLIRELTSEISYDHHGEENRLSLRFDILRP